jgi:hypothetical protein
VRSEEMQPLISAVGAALSSYFQRLYDDLPFDVDFESGAVMKAIAPMSWSGPASQFTSQAIEAIDSSKGGLHSASAAGVGAAIGMVLGPLGAGVGALIGGWLADDTTNKDLLEKVYEACWHRLKETSGRVMETVLADFADDEKHTSPFLHALFAATERERERFARLITDKIADVEHRRVRLRSATSHAQDIASAAADWAERLAGLRRSLRERADSGAAQ